MARGAVTKGLTTNNLSHSIAVAVQSRIARASYGTLVNIVPFEAEEHEACDRVWCAVQQVFVAVDQTQWFLEIVSYACKSVPGGPVSLIQLL